MEIPVPTQEQQAPEHEAQALQAFAVDYLLPKTLALIDKGLDHDFFDRFSPALPELVPPLLRALSEHELAEARITAGYQTKLRADTLGPEFLADTLGRLIHDPDPEVADLARHYTSSVAEDRRGTHPELAAAARQLLETP